MSYNHIIKTADERVLCFFIKEGLCVKDLMSPTDKYKIIYEEAVCDFFVIDTGMGEVGIVCQDDKGSIIFLRESNNSYLKTTLLNNRSQVAYDKNFKLCRHNKWISLSYVINYQEEKLLSFQLVNEENTAPMVVDYVDSCEYFSFVNKSEDLLFFYNKESEFGCKIYKWSKKDFDSYEKLGDGKIISAISDNYGMYYIIYEKDSNFFLRVIDNKEFDFLSSDYPLDFLKINDKINMLIEKKMLWITVNRNGFTFGRKCNLNDFSFSGIYNFANEGNLIDYKVSINEEDYILNSCFGYSVNMRPKLILYKDLMNTSKIKNKTADIEIKEELDEFYEEKREELNEYDVRITKLEIRVKELEDKLKKNIDTTEKSDSYKEIKS